MYYEVLQVQPLTVHPICEVRSTGMLNDTFRTKTTNASDPKSTLRCESEDLQSFFTHTHKRKRFKTSPWEDNLETAPFFPLNYKQNLNYLEDFHPD